MLSAKKTVEILKIAVDMYNTVQGDQLNMAVFFW